MGTRALVHFEEDGEVIATVYRQFDGYPTGLGQDIFGALNNGAVEMRNGFGGSDKVPSQFNGMGCLAAFIVGALKGDKIGSVYMMKAGTSDVGEEFTYTLYLKGGEGRLPGELHLKISGYSGDPLFEGPLSKFDAKAVES